MGVSGLTASLDELIRRAKPVPLTNQVRLDKNSMYAILDDMRTTVSRVGMPDALTSIDAMDVQIRNAKPVPLTDEVRLERAELEKLAGEIRARVSRATN